MVFFPVFSAPEIDFPDDSGFTLPAFGASQGFIISFLGVPALILNTEFKFGSALNAFNDLGFHQFFLSDRHRIGSMAAGRLRPAMTDRRPCAARPGNAGFRMAVFILRQLQNGLPE